MVGPLVLSRSLWLPSRRRRMRGRAHTLSHRIQDHRHRHRHRHHILPRLLVLQRISMPLDEPSARAAWSWFQKYQL